MQTAPQTFAILAESLFILILNKKEKKHLSSKKTLLFAKHHISNVCKRRLTPTFTKFQFI